MAKNKKRKIVKKLKEPFTRLVIPLIGVAVGLTAIKTASSLANN